MKWQEGEHLTLEGRAEPAVLSERGKNKKAPTLLFLVCVSSNQGLTTIVTAGLLMICVQTGENKQIQQWTPIQFFCFLLNRASKQPTDVNCMGGRKEGVFLVPDKGEIVP